MILEFTVSFFLAVFISGIAATLWVLYMIKLVTNEEELAERIRNERRRREELRRQEADRANRRQHEQAAQEPTSLLDAMQSLAGAKKATQEIAGGGAPEPEDEE